MKYIFFFFALIFSLSSFAQHTTAPVIVTGKGVKPASTPKADSTRIKREKHYHGNGHVFAFDTHDTSDVNQEYWRDEKIMKIHREIAQWMARGVYDCYIVISTDHKNDTILGYVGGDRARAILYRKTAGTKTGREKLRVYHLHKGEIEDVIFKPTE